MGAASETRACKHLIILDVNGLLVERWWPKLSGDPQPVNGRSTTLPRGVVVYDRPFMRSTVELICKNFNVLVWSSMMEHNLRDIVTHCFGDSRKGALLDVWDQSRCTRVSDDRLPPGFREKHNIIPGKPIFLKELSRLQEVADLRDFYPDNVLLIDDSPYKVVRNPPYTSIHPLSWVIRTDGSDAPKDNELELLTKYLKRLQNYDTVTEFVRLNPFPLWKAFQDRVLHEKQIEHASSWCVRRAGQADALVNIWEKELLKSKPEKKEHLLSVATMALKIARSIADRGGAAPQASAEGLSSSAALAIVGAMWPIFPRAVGHTMRNCKPGKDEEILYKSVVDTFNITFDPRKLLNTRAGESLGPLWREVEHAAKQGSNLPSLADVSAIWRSSYDDGPVEFARRLAEARPDSHSTGPTSSQGGLHPVKEYRDRAKRQRSQ